MLGTIEGICTTCNDGPTCVRRKSHGQPVWYCEEFDDYVLPSIKTFRSDSVLMPGSHLVEDRKAEQDTDKHSGVCINCSTRNECSFSELGSDIWQCNEYS